MRTGPLLLAAVGAVMVILAVLWRALGRFPVGRLPGDVVISRPGLTVYIPITSMILLSVLLTLVVWAVRRLS